MKRLMTTIYVDNETEAADMLHWLTLTKRFFIPSLDWDVDWFEVKEDTTTGS